MRSEQPHRKPIKKYEPQFSNNSMLKDKIKQNQLKK
jgi:hypothetical protein